jgi:tetratricopeptide (TPR) repeat protein
VHAQEALKRNPDTPKAYLALAMAEVGRGQIQEALQWWNRASQSSAQGASLAAIGIADLSLYNGRHAEVETLLSSAISADRQARNTAGVAAKLIARAEARQLAGDRKDAIALAKEALGLNTAESIVVPAARVMLASGRRAEALAVAAELGKRLNPRARAYGKVIESEAALHEGRTLEAVEAARAALKLADLWLVRYALGVAYVQAGAHAEALAELEACDKRRGEATSVFLNDVPSWRYMAPLAYWLGRAREGVGLENHALDSYRAYVALRPPTLKDALADDARRRLGG